MTDDTGEAGPTGPGPDGAEAARRFFARPWTFLTSAPSAGALPAEGPVEVAFAGRSNVGKSSLINAVCGQKGLARTSNTPGRTQALNFFVPRDSAAAAGAVPPLAIVDLPGYGFARAPKAQVDAWTRFVFGYLKGRATLKRVFVLVDSRHGIKQIDRDLFDMLDKAAVSYQLVLTKADKLGEAALDEVERATRAAVARRPAAFPDLVVTSSERNRGIDDLRWAIHALLPPESGA